MRHRSPNYCSLMGELNVKGRCISITMAVTYCVLDAICMVLYMEEFQTKLKDLTVRTSGQTCLALVLKIHKNQESLASFVDPHHQPTLNRYIHACSSTVMFMVWEQGRNNIVFLLSF